LWRSLPLSSGPFHGYKLRIGSVSTFCEKHWCLGYGATCNNPFNARGRPSRSCSSPQPQCSLAQERVGGRQGKVSPGEATRCANLVRGGRRRRGRCELRFPSDRTRASRGKVAPFAHHATLPNEDYHTEKSVLFPKKDRLDGFRAKRADTAFRQKTRRNISRLQRRENVNHTPHSKPITHAHANAGQQSSLRRKCISLADPREQPERGFAVASSGLTPPPQPPACPKPSRPAPAATARGTSR